MKGRGPFEIKGSPGETENFGATITFVLDVLDQGLRSYREEDQHGANEGEKKGVNICFEAIH
jgi:hypothetical protein